MNRGDECRSACGCKTQWDVCAKQRGCACHVQAVREQERLAYLAARSS